MKYLTPIVFAILGAVIVVFSVKNLQPMELNPWPLGAPVEAPTYLVVLVGLLVGFFTGAGIAWLAGFSGRRRAARQRRENRKLTQEIERLKAGDRRIARSPSPADSGAPAADPIGSGPVAG